MTGPAAYESRLARFGALGLAGLFLALALYATLTSQPGLYIPDNLLQDIVDPGEYLSQHAYLWDEMRGLGRPRSDFSPVVATFQAGLRMIQVEPWVVERITHAIYLLVAAMGVVLLLRALRPRIGLGHGIAGFAYAFSPFTAEFLSPSGSYLLYCLAPWFALIALRGVRGDDPWRWAAAFALALAIPGLLNGAAMGFALLPAALVAGYFALAEPGGLRRVWGWVWRTGVLSALTCSAGIVVLLFSGSEVAGLLHTTEQPAQIARTSSWAESWRGLGFWVSYFPDVTGMPIRSQGIPYFTQPFVIAATFLAPVGALLALALGGWRYRWLFGGMLLVGLTSLVGVYGAEGPSPLGEVFQFAFDHSDFALGFRTTYKAGSTLMLGVAILLGVGVDEAMRAAGRRQTDRRRNSTDDRIRPLLLGIGVPTVVSVALVLSASPFWNGNLYPDSQGFRSIPRYWDQTFSFFEARPAARVLVLPASEQNRYRWGAVNDSLFNGLAPVTPVSNRSFGGTTAESANLTSAIDDYVSSNGYVEGSLSPILERLGVRWVLLQNDIAWQQTGTVRPSTYQALRDDPGLRPKASFGPRGVNTFELGDPLAAQLGESQLPPVEIYEVKSAPTPYPRAVEGPPLLVSGAGDSWPALAPAGLLDGPPIAYSGAADDDELRDLVRSGAQVVVSDGNRRRALSLGTSRPSQSPTLTTADTGKQIQDLFGGVDTQSVASYPDATQITGSRFGFSFGATEYPARPASAFDGVERTAWKLRGTVEPDQEWMVVALREPAAVTGVSAIAVSEGRWRIREVDLIARTDDGQETHGSLRFDGTPRARAKTHLRAADVTELELRIGKIKTPSPAGIEAIGIAEIKVETADGPLDLREFVSAPGDLASRAAEDQELAAQLAERPPRYELRRVTGIGGEDEETELRRRITAFGDHSYEFSATARVSDRTADSAIYGLLGRTVGGITTSHFGGRGGLAVDDDLQSGWEPVPREGERLEIRFPSTQVIAVEVLVDSGNRSDSARAGPRRPRLEQIGVSVGDSSVVSNLPDEPRCELDSPRGTCLESHVVRLPRAETDRLSVTLDTIELVKGRSGGTLPKLVEVRINGSPVSVTGEIPPKCAPLFAIDGKPVPIRLPGPLALLGGGVFELRSCDPVRMGPGEHTIETLPGLSGAVLTTSLVPVGQRRPAPEAPDRDGVKLVDRSPTQMDLDVDAPTGSLLVSRVPADDGWTADDDRLRRSPVPLDTFSAWTVEDATDGPMRLSFGPQRAYELALALSLASALWCLWRVTRRRRSAR